MSDSMEQFQGIKRGGKFDSIQFIDRIDSLDDLNRVNSPDESSGHFNPLHNSKKKF
jgi:hypothetical protein